MKTLTLKVLGCAATLALLTVTRAQNADDGQAVPPPDTTTPPAEVVTPAQPQQDTPPVIVVPVPAEMLDTNSGGNANGAPPDTGPNPQPMQNAQPNQFRGNNGQNQYQGRGNSN